MDTIKNFYWYDAVDMTNPQVKKAWDDYQKIVGSKPPENTSLALWAACSRMLLRAISKAGTIEDTHKVAEVLRAMPVEDPYLGKGAWIGKKFFGINQEVSFPFAMGMVIDGKLQPTTRMPATTE